MPDEFTFADRMRFDRHSRRFAAIVKKRGTDSFEPGSIGAAGICGTT